MYGGKDTNSVTRNKKTFKLHEFEGFCRGGGI